MKEVKTTKSYRASTETVDKMKRLIELEIPKKNSEGAWLEEGINLAYSKYRLEWVNKVVNEMLDGLSNAGPWTFYKGQKLKDIYLLNSNWTSCSKVKGMSDAVNAALLIEGLKLKVLVGDHWESEFNEKHGLGIGEIREQ